MNRYLTISDLDVAEKRVLVRSDLNVPLEDGVISDDYRVRQALPTINRLAESGAVVIVSTHLGRPDGPDPALSTAPVAVKLAELGGFPVRHLSGVIGAEVSEAIASAEAGDVLMLENTRFEPGETKDDPTLADSMAELADYFVEDAFGSVHRAHASTHGVAERIESAAGDLLIAELEALKRLLENPQHPYRVILGGAKISDKLAVIENLLPTVDQMLIGGGMCFTLLAARGIEVGNSLVQTDMIEKVGELLEGPDGAKIVLPDDVVVATAFAEDAPSELVEVEAIPDGTMGLDIGPQTVARFSAEIATAETVFWNGPMGVFEWERFRAGTEGVANALAGCSGFTVVGGGDSVAAIRLLDLENEVDHVSTGGGAGLELLEGKDLPGVTVLERWTR